MEIHPNPYTLKVNKLVLAQNTFLFRAFVTPPPPPHPQPLTPPVFGGDHQGACDAKHTSKATRRRDTFANHPCHGLATRRLDRTSPHGHPHRRDSARRQRPAERRSVLLFPVVRKAVLHREIHHLCPDVRRGSSGHRVYAVVGLTWPLVDFSGLLGGGRGPTRPSWTFATGTSATGTSATGNCNFFRSSGFASCCRIWFAGCRVLCCWRVCSCKDEGNS